MWPSPIFKSKEWVTHLKRYLAFIKNFFGATKPLPQKKSGTNHLSYQLLNTCPELFGQILKSSLLGRKINTFCEMFPSLFTKMDGRSSFETPIKEKSRVLK